ncbi:MAG: alpha/beta hydrolase [Methanobrevibacter sp.]|uniref:alpha/beta fold hydrolase n=1 Tax=Methanobrevibacter sp. TaxID=66852 RepID=UPI0025FEA0DA|nr:alpha/beta hydrolase [Methanobrevibacter sp.]MBR0271006.1 alpha/beta hydrolase [Methanobrevibacter sp.]
MKTNFLYFGQGEKTIVFIHGLSDDLTYWMELSSELENEYKILLYDIRGHGKSESGDFSIDILADDLHELLFKLSITKASFIGFSLGGNIALAFALKYPEIVEKMILMASFSQCDEQLESRFLEFKNALDISFEEFYDVIIKYVLPEEIIGRNREVLDHIKHEKARTSNVEAIKSGVNMGFGFNCTDQLHKIDVPTLILAGRNDEIVGLDLIEILNKNIKNSGLVIFDDTKHNLLIGRNIQQILKLIRKFI